MIIHSDKTYDRNSQNQIKSTKKQGIEGARALIESFYYAFNHRDMDVFSQVWADNELIQLNNPLGGIIRGYTPISELYQRIFTGSAKVWVELSDIVEYQTNEMIVFAGREKGEFSDNEDILDLSIRTSRIVQWLGEDIGWKQTHHHGSIDNPELLAKYQSRVKMK